MNPIIAAGVQFLQAFGLQDIFVKFVLYMFGLLMIFAGVKFFVK